MSRWTKGDLQVGDTLNRPMNLPVGATGTALVADSTQEGGVKWQQRSRAIGNVNDSGGAITVVSSSGETTMATQAVPTTVAAGDVLEWIIGGDQLNNVGVNANYTYKFKLGGTTCVAFNALATSTSANRRIFIARAVVEVVSVTADQRMLVTAWQNGATASTGAFGASTGAGRGTAAEDLTAGKNLLFTVTLGTADATIDFRLHEAALVIHKA